MNQPFTFLDVSNLLPNDVDTLRAILDPKQPSPQVELHWDTSTAWNPFPDEAAEVVGGDASKVEDGQQEIAYSTAYSSGDVLVSQPMGYTMTLQPPFFVRYVPPPFHPMQQHSYMEDPEALGPILAAPPPPVFPPPAHMAYTLNVDASPFTMTSPAYTVASPATTAPYIPPTAEETPLPQEKTVKLDPKPEEPPAPPSPEKEAEAKQAPVKLSYAAVARSTAPSSSSATRDGAAVHQNGDCAPPPPSKATAEDILVPKLSKLLESLHIDNSVPLLFPRGLINRKNWCYINATLQAFLACSPLYNLLKSISSLPNVNNRKSSTPILDGLIKFVNEFNVPAGEEDSQPFEPVEIYKMLGLIKSKCAMGQQEDAEEFLSSILDGLNEEIVATMNRTSSKTGNGEALQVSNGHMTGEEEDWQVVSNKKKCILTKTQNSGWSPVTDIFQGHLKKVVTLGGNTTITIEPFYALRLDIQGENVSTVEEALDKLMSREPIHGYTCPRTRQPTEIFQHYYLARLPHVLILCFKRFIYDTEGCKKIHKKVSFPLKLEISKEYLSTEKKNNSPQVYDLFAVVYHDGEEAVKGHYIADVLHPKSGGWLRCNDRMLTPVTEEDVLLHAPPRVPYMLFYQR